MINLHDCHRRKDLVSDFDFRSFLPLSVDEAVISYILMPVFYRFGLAGPGEGEPGGFPAGVPARPFFRVLHRLQVFVVVWYNCSDMCVCRALMFCLLMQQSAKFAEESGVVALRAADSSGGDETWETTRDLHYSSGARVTLQEGRQPSVLYKVSHTMHRSV